jgi:hypothetical protein
VRRRKPQNRSQSPFTIEICRENLIQYIHVNRAITLSQLRRASPGNCVYMDQFTRPQSAVTGDLGSVEAGFRLGAVYMMQVCQARMEGETSLMY